MKAILIDPAERSIAQIETPAELGDLYQLIGDGCDCIDSAYPFGKSEAVFVADDSALRTPALPYFYVPGYAWPLFGRAVILGLTTNGASCSTRMSVDQLSQIITFQ